MPPVAAKKPTAAGAPRDSTNLQASEEVFETIDFTKFKTKLMVQVSAELGEG